MQEYNEFNMWKSRRIVYAGVKNNSLKFFHGSDSTQRTREKREKRRLSSLNYRRN